MTDVRIADILISHAVPGAFVLDRTEESTGLSAHAALAPELGLRYGRGPAAAGEAVPLLLVLHNLAPAGSQAPAPIDLAQLGGLAPSVAHVVFFDRVEAFLENGLIDLATRGGYELASTHRTEHKIFRLAAVFRRPDGDSSSTRLRLVNEYRFDKFLLSELEHEQIQWRQERDQVMGKLSDLRASYQQLRSEREQLRATHEQERVAFQQLRIENKLLDMEYQRMARARDQARRETEDALEQVKAYEARLAAMYQALRRSRKSLGFRLGLATWTAVAGAGKNVFAIPRRWIRTFRGPDQVLEKLRPVARLGTGGPARRESRAEVADIEKRTLLLGLEPAAQPTAGVAGVVGPGFAAEMAASTRFRALAPHNWRHLLEAELPTYVLVTADGLMPGAPWGGWGTPGGRDGHAMLRELVSWCRSIQLPVVYWDTMGAGRRFPLGLRFHWVFTISRRGARGVAQGAETLLPAIEPLVWNPVAVAPTAPNHPIYAGAFDRRGDRAEFAALEVLLRAAAGRGLEILDIHAGLQGPLARAVRFPPGLDSLARRPPPAEDVRAAVKRAGIAVCGNPFAGCDAPSWDLLRGLAMGVHVVSTPADLEDEVLVTTFESAGDTARANEAFDRVARRQLLDATWRRGFDHLLARYSLRDRLDQIALRCGVVPVAAPKPSVALVARLGSEAEARALRGFLAAQTVAPAEVRVLVEAELGIDAHVADVVDPARMVSLRAADPHASSALGDSRATHLLCWSSGTPVIAEAIADLTHAARLAHDDVLALAPEHGATGPAVYRRGELPVNAVVAVRRAAVLGHLREGTPPEAAAALLVARGSGCLINLHPSASAGARRSVA